jgi:hypothetical protein
MNLHALIEQLRDVRTLTGDPLVSAIAEDAARAIESLMDRLVRQACYHEVIEAQEQGGDEHDGDE